MTPSAAARSITGANRSNDSSTVQRMLAWQKASVAAVKISTCRAPAEIARSYPRSFGTRQMKSMSCRSGRAGTSSSASASWGIAFGLTKLVASMRRQPASINRSIRVILSASETGVDSFCRPSRGPTSMSSTGRRSDTDQPRNGAILRDGHAVVALAGLGADDLVSMSRSIRAGSRSAGIAQATSAGQVKHDLGVGGHVRGCLSG